MYLSTSLSIEDFFCSDFIEFIISFVSWPVKTQTPITQAVLRREQPRKQS